MTIHTSTRRSILGSGIATGICLASGLPLAAAPVAAPIVARISLDDKVYEFHESRGRDLGDYVGRGFVQRCIVVTVPDLPMSVFLRPDRDSDRVEVVFELGRMWNEQPRHLGRYTVEIKRGERQLAQIEVPKHYWFSRWRWQSAPRPIVASPPQLIAAGLLPPYAVNGVGGVHGGASSRRYSIMGLAGVAAYMPTTGERDDIGALTEVQARWVCTQAGDALESLLDQAEASGTVPWNVRDEKTGAPFNFEQYPNGGWYPDAASPYVEQVKSDITPDAAHHPGLTYLPFLLTGDPYYLEALQLSTTWCIGSAPAGYRQFNGRAIVPHAQTRGYAWVLRDVAQLAKVTPATVPGWLLPQAYWAKLLENNRVWFEKTFLQSDDPAYRMFRAAPKYEMDERDAAIRGALIISPWSDEFLAFILGWMVLMGFDGWRNIFAWKVNMTIARTDGKSGWVRAYATPYRLVIRRSQSTPWPRSWAEAWALNAELQDFKVTDPNRWSQPTPIYLGYTRGVLALAKRLGIPDAAECFNWANEEQARLRQISYKWAVVG